MASFALNEVDLRDIENIIIRKVRVFKVSLIVALKQNISGISLKLKKLYYLEYFNVLVMH